MIARLQFRRRTTDASNQMHRPNANMADRSVSARDESNESEVSQSSMFCFDIAFP